MFPVGAAAIQRVTGSPLGTDEPADLAFDYSGQDLKPYLTPGNRGKKFYKAIPLARHSQWRFSTESIEYLREGFASPFFAYHPALAVVLNVNYPEDKFEIFIDLSNGEIETDALRIPHLNGVKWILKNPLLPGHGISTRIVRIPPAAAHV